MNDTVAIVIVNMIVLCEGIGSVLHSWLAWRLIFVVSRLRVFEFEILQFLLVSSRLLCSVFLDTKHKKRKCQGSRACGAAPIFSEQLSWFKQPVSFSSIALWLLTTYLWYEQLVSLTYTDQVFSKSSKITLLRCLSLDIGFLDSHVNHNLLIFSS